MREEKLRKIFGERFLQTYRKESSNRGLTKLTPEERREVIKQIPRKITPDNPKFAYKNYDVILVETPDRNLIRREPWEGVVSIPMIYRDGWVSVLFNDPNLAEPVEEGEVYFIVGRYYERQGSDGRIFYNMRARDIIAGAEASDSAESHEEPKEEQGTKLDTEPKKEPSVDKNIKKWYE